LCDVIAHKDEYADVIGGWAISSLLTNSQPYLDWMIQQYFPLQILIIPVSSYFTAQSGVERILCLNRELQHIKASPNM